VAKNEIILKSSQLSYMTLWKGDTHQTEDHLIIMPQCECFSSSNEGHIQMSLDTIDTAM